MIAQENHYSKKIYYLRIALIICVLLFLSGLCDGLSLNFGEEYKSEGGWCTVRIEYPSPNRILNGNVIEVKLRAEPKSDIDIITPPYESPWRELASDVGRQLDWDVSLKPGTKKTELFVEWRTTKGKQVSGWTPLRPLSSNTKSE